MDHKTHDKLLTVIMRLCYVFSALGLVLSLNSYFRLIPVIDYLHIGNAHIAFFVQFMALSLLYMLLFLLVVPPLKEKKIMGQIFALKCQMIPIIPVLFFASKQYHFAYLSLFIIHILFFISNEICFQKKIFPNGNYHTHKILVTIGFASTALIMHSVNTIKILF